MRRREMRREMLIELVSKTVEAHKKKSMKIALQTVQEGEWWVGTLQRKRSGQTQVAIDFKKYESVTHLCLEK